jgi:Fe-S-cluster containining protein
MKKKSKINTGVIKNKLDNLYSKIPDTTGCTENICKDVGCNAWCCRLQSPSLTYAEFINIWNHILKTWNFKDICSLVKSALDRYLNAGLKSGCIFLDKDSKLCLIHTVRPFNCRCYGVVPEEEFKQRQEHYAMLLKEGVVNTPMLDQCNLIHITDDKKITSQDMDNWFNELVSIEKQLGRMMGEKLQVTDAFGGTYRQPHEHMLIHNFSEKVMADLSIIRTGGTFQEKLIAIENCVNLFKEIAYNQLTSGKNVQSKKN